MRHLLLLASTILMSTNAATLALADPAAPRAFATGVPISTGGEGWEASVAVDGAGRSVAVWDERTANLFVVDRIWTKSRPLSGPWGARTILSRSWQTTYVYPKVLTSVDGTATAVWSDYGGAWTADRSPAGVWSKAVLILPDVSAPNFVMNGHGDAALLWGSNADRAGPTQLNVMRRSAGGAWGAPQILATGVHVTIDGAALGDNGDLVAAWERYTAVCTRHCLFSNFELHASRQAKGSTSWQDSGALTGLEAKSHDASAVVDPDGHAGAVYLSSLGMLTAITQARAGAAWSAPTTVYSNTDLFMAGFATDGDGKATLALLEFNASASFVKTITGSIIANSWNAPVTVSGADQSPNQVAFAESSSGTAVLAWAAGDPSFSNNKIRVSSRPTTEGAWTAPRTISPAGVQFASPEAAAVNNAGNATVIFSAFNASFSNHTEYASSN